MQKISSNHIFFVNLDFCWIFVTVINTRIKPNYVFLQAKSLREVKVYCPLVPITRITDVKATFLKSRFVSDWKKNNNKKVIKLETVSTMSNLYSFPKKIMIRFI